MGMSNVIGELSISLDGYAAGPNQSEREPLGEGGERLHEWAVRTAAWRRQHGLDGGEDGVDSQIVAASTANVGAYLMGRRMFGGGEGPWDPSWRGWWGEDAPFRAPVFVLTHHPRAPLRLDGGTTFTFVTDGVEAALDRARAAADGRDVRVVGGAATVRQCLRAGLLDELQLHIAPVVLGAGERLLDDVGDPTLELVETVPSSAVTHVRYRVVR